MLCIGFRTTPTWVKCLGRISAGASWGRKPRRAWDTGGPGARATRHENRKTGRFAMNGALCPATMPSRLPRCGGRRCGAGSETRFLSQTGAEAAQDKLDTLRLRGSMHVNSAGQVWNPTNASTGRVPTQVPQTRSFQRSSPWCGQCFSQARPGRMACNTDNQLLQQIRERTLMHISARDGAVRFYMDFCPVHCGDIFSRFFIPWIFWILNLMQLGFGRTPTNKLKTWRKSCLLGAYLQREHVPWQVVQSILWNPWLAAWKYVASQTIFRFATMALRERTC